MTESPSRKPEPETPVHHVLLGNEASQGGPAAFYCPITHSIMKDPVGDSEGFSYDRPAIEEWLKEPCASPTTRKGLTIHQLVPNRALRDAIANHMGEHLLL